MKHLVVVDMQHDFGTSHDTFLRAEVIKQIRRAKVHEWPIIVLEYYNSGQTLEDISTALSLCDNVYYLTKDEDDGTSVIAEVANISGNEFILCGVNLCACVKRTAEGLLAYGGRVEIVEEACNCCCGADCRTTLQSLLKAA